MKMIGKRFYIKVACFLAAFAAVGAGFAYCARLVSKELEEREAASERLAASEGAVNLERLAGSLSQLLLAPEGKKSVYLSDIRLYASLSEAALGNIELKSEGGRSLFAFLSGASLLSENALELGIAAEISTATAEGFTAEKAPSASAFSLLAYYAARIEETALPHLTTDKERFESALDEIFSDTGLETLLYESGYGSLVQIDAYPPSAVIAIDEKDALELARKHLGKNAHLSITLSENGAFYHIFGKNISAAVSAAKGVIEQFLFDTAEGELALDEKEAMENADKLLSYLGFNTESMAVSPGKYSKGLYIFEYTPLQKGILCLNEKILIGVSGDTGRIHLFDASSYYRYHRKELTLPSGMISSEEIMAEYALAEKPELCKIERTDGIESLCYRFPVGQGSLLVSALSGVKIEI